jgi:hypothetical protein
MFRSKDGLDDVRMGLCVALENYAPRESRGRGIRLYQVAIESKTHVLFNLSCMRKSCLREPVHFEVWTI